MHQALGRATQDDTPRNDILIISVWFGLVTGMVEGLLFFHVRHFRILDLTWVPIPVDLVLALVVALPLLALRNFLTGRPSPFLRVVCLFAWLMFFDWLRVTSPAFETALSPHWSATILSRREHLPPAKEIQATPPGRRLYRVAAAWTSCNRLTANVTLSHSAWLRLIGQARRPPPSVTSSSVPCGGVC